MSPVGCIAVPTEKRQRQKEGHQARKEAALAQARRQARKRRLISLSVIVVGFLAIMLIISLVSDDDSTDVSAGEDTETTETSETTEAEATTTPTSAKPADPEPGGDAPVTELVKEDILVGEGAEVKAGDTIVAHYLGATYADGKPFQASWDSGQTFETVIGEGAVIQGWDEGIPGMKVGGRRKLIIPAEMAYGAEDTGDGRPHGDLVFIIDVYAIK